MDKDGDGRISPAEYFAIFEAHGIVVNKSEANRVMRLVGEKGRIDKEKFVKIVQPIGGAEGGQAGAAQFCNKG